MDLESILVSRSRAGLGVTISANYGKQRVISTIPRTVLDDYFERTCPDMDDRERLWAVDSNVGVFARHLLEKCAAGEWRDGRGCKEIDITLDDLRTGPRLSAEFLDRSRPGFRNV
ncbi:hypothetical protein [Bradyrhizobium sp. USDA 4471]